MEDLEWNRKSFKKRLAWAISDCVLADRRVEDREILSKMGPFLSWLIINDSTQVELNETSIARIARISKSEVERLLDSQFIESQVEQGLRSVFRLAWTSGLIINNPTSNRAFISLTPEHEILLTFEKGYSGEEDSPWMTI